jgi:DNA-binding CsgD family transcriptional regulator
MHTCALLEESKRVARSESSPLAEAFRSLLSLLERTDRSDAEGSANGNQTEQVLVDTEVDGNRYLVIRMPRSLYNRVQLSPREQEIVRMVAQGHPNKVIADVLNISAWTVCTHLRRIFAKLGVGSRAAMVAQLLELGVVRKDYQLHAHHR